MTMGNQFINKHIFSHILYFHYFNAKILYLLQISIIILTQIFKQFIDLILKDPFWL